MPRIAVVLLMLLPTVLAAAEKPNIVVVLTDDQGWGDLSIHGNTNLKTPHFDALAKAGAQFDRYFVQPVCSPTRAEFLTGRYHPRGGVRGVSTGGERLNWNEKTIADSFKKAGYATAAFGKWHNGSQFPYHPTGRGFDTYVGFTSGHWGEYFNSPLEDNFKPIRGEGFMADDLTNRAIAFMQQETRKEQPFFCYLAFNTPHSPMQVPDEYWNRFKDRELKLGPTAPQKEAVGHSRAALAMCENLDDNMGRLVAALDKMKIAENTILVYFSDNGPNGWRWNGNMKGRKGGTDEGGVRSPLFIRWPKKIAPGTTIQPIAGAIDLLPTLLELANVPRVGEAVLDGTSFASALLGKKHTGKEGRVLVQYWAGKISVRSQTHRLDADGKLFDMISDPSQLKDIANAQPDIAAKLMAQRALWRVEVLAGQTNKDDRPFTVGHSGAKITPLPARDGVSHGTIRRSAGAPNCSYFTNWTKPDDSITWNVEVGTAGNYQVDVLYACAKENLGAKMQLNLNDAKITGIVTEAHDPPFYGQANDRVPRMGESYMKDFKPWNMGIIALPKGNGTLTFKALEILGKQAIEVRGLTLTLMKD